MDAFYRLEDEKLIVRYRDVDRLERAMKDLNFIDGKHGRLAPGPRVGKTKTCHLANETITGFDNFQNLFEGMEEVLKKWCLPGSYFEVYNDDERVASRVKLNERWKVETEEIGYTSPFAYEEEITKLKQLAEHLEYRNAVLLGTRSTGVKSRGDAPVPGTYPETSDNPYELTQKDVEASFDPALVEVMETAWVRVAPDGTQALAQCWIAEDDESPNGLGWYYATWEWNEEQGLWHEYDGGCMWGYQNADELEYELPWPPSIADGEYWQAQVDCDLLEDVLGDEYLAIEGRRMTEEELKDAFMAETRRLDGLLQERGAELRAEVERCGALENRVATADRYLAGASEAISDKNETNAKLEERVDVAETRAAELTREIARMQDAIESIGSQIAGAETVGQARQAVEEVFGRWLDVAPVPIASTAQLDGAPKPVPSPTVGGKPVGRIHDKQI